MTNLSVGVTYTHLAALCRASDIGVLPYQAAYQPLEMDTILRKHGTAMLKAGMEILGYAGGPVRAGLKVLNQAERAELRQLLEPLSGGSLIP